MAVRRAVWVALVCATLPLSAGCSSGRAYQQGVQAGLRGDWDLAVTYFTDATRADPERPDYKMALERAQMAAAQLHFEKAREYEKKDQLDLALLEYRKVVEFHATNSEARAKIQTIEQTVRDRIEASRPRPPIEAMRERARKDLADPLLNPASREPLNMKYSGAQLRDILSFIGAATGINVSFDRDFQDRPYTVELNGVTLEQALQQLMTANSLFYKVLNERSIIIIPDTQPKRAFYEEQAVQTFYLSNADPQEIVTLLNTVVRVQQAIQPMFAANKSSNTITVRATVPMLQIIARVIEANDKPRAEIVIDVEILEVNKDRAKQYGLELSQYAVGLNFAPEARPGTPASGTTDPASTFNLNTVSAGISSADFYATVPSAVVRFLESDSQNKIIAKPQLRGSEGEKLTLNLGEELPVPSTTFTPIAAGGTAYNPMTSFQYKPVGVNVEIEPRVTYEGDIIMKIGVEVSARGTDANIAGQNLPTFFSRKVNTRLRLRDGESNLLAGLLQETERKSLKGFPGAIHVPVLKQLFSSNDNEIKTTDIVMLLTPHIVRTHELTQRDLSPIYVGTQQNLNLTGAPQLIAPQPGADVPPAQPAAPVTGRPGFPGPPVAGSVVPGPPGSPVTAIVPPGSSPIPGTVGVPASPAAAVSSTAPAEQPQPPVPTDAPVVAPPGSSPVPGTVGVPAQPPARAPQPPQRPSPGPPASAPTSAPTPVPVVVTQPSPAAPPVVAQPQAAPTPAPPPAAVAPPAPTAAAQLAQAPGVLPRSEPTQVALGVPTTPMMVAGGPYTIPITIDQASRLSTVTVTLTFNPRVLKVRLAQEGSFMRQGSAMVTFAQQVDATSGRIDITVSRTADTTGASGAGLLAAIIFDAVGSGPCALTLSGIATAPGGAPLQLQFTPATVTVR